MASAFETRTRACQERLAERDASAAVLAPGPNLYYLSGFHAEPWDRLFLLFVPAEGEPRFVVPGMFDAQIRDVSWIEVIHTWADESGPADALQRVGEHLELASGRLLLDDRMWATYVQALRRQFPDATYGLASEVLDDLRERKDELEIEAIERASEIADEVSEEIRSLGATAVGMTERELALEVEAAMTERGAEGLPFDVASTAGPNTARVFYHHGDREVAAGEPVLLDFGCIVDRYCSDQTRMVVFDGEPPEEFERVYDAVLAAYEAGVSAVEPGVPAESVEQACHEVLEEHGYADRVQHRTGHGVGLTPNEGPAILTGNTAPLRPGMVFSVEPGVYFEGRFGVRLEDLVVVTEDGCRSLNHSPMTWRPL